jgi:hypothetical protein
MTRELVTAYRFHRENSASRVGNHAADALDYARAELAARNLGWSVTWEYDPDADLGDHAYWCNDQRRADAGYGADGDRLSFFSGYGHEHDHETTYAVLRDADGEHLASLGGIIDADATYRRTVEAELALEALPSPIPTSALYACA